MFTWSDRTGRLAGTAVTRRLGWGEILALTKSTAPASPADGDISADTLVHELADQELDLLDLALALEVDFTVIASELRSGKLRTYGELTEALLALTRGRSEPEPIAWARIVPGNATPGAVHAGALSADAVRIITAAALEGGRGTTVEITVAAPTVDRHRPHADASARWSTADAIAGVEARFAALAARGIVVTVQPNVQPEPRAAERQRQPRGSWWKIQRPTGRRPAGSFAPAKVAVAS